MRKRILSIAVTLFASLGVLFAGEAFKPQTACPVTGKPIDKKVYVEYQGQRIYFCCPKCTDAFRKDPEAYFAKFEKDQVELENIQTSCPVSGEKLSEHGEPAVIHFKGRTVKFCCPSCEKPFRAEAEKYLNTLPGEQKKGSEKS